MKAEITVNVKYEIEVNGKKDPQDALMDQILEDFGEYETYFVVDTDIVESDCQYSDQDELLDRERDSEI